MERGPLVRLFGALADAEVVRVSLATPRTLYRMKRDTARPIDAQDAERLGRAFDLVDDG